MVLTGKWEKKLSEIGQGKADHLAFIEQAKRLARKLVVDANQSISLGSETMEKAKDQDSTSVATHSSDRSEKTSKSPEIKNKQPIGRCSLCGDNMVDRGSFYGCNSYVRNGCRFSISKSILGVQIPHEQLRLLLQEGETQLIKGFKSKNNQRTFNAVLCIEEGKLAFRIPNKNVFSMPLNLLEPASKISRTEEDTNQEFNLIQKELRAIKLPAEVTGVTHGPRVSRYELLPDQGVNINAYKRFKANFQAVLQAQKISIYVPIPGTNRIGIEVPNKHPYPVQIRGLLENQEYLVKKKELSFPLGMDLQGNPVIGDLASMPHLLVAGTTGSGKSVFLNSLIISLLASSTPDQLKLMFIDPKQVELSVYAELPHLFLPIVSEANRATVALTHLIREMERRYRILRDNGVRNIASYNEKNPTQKLPYIVLIIDELADLIMVADGVEELVQRIAQLARASGIHMVVATQRPTKQVLSPTIKSNLPVRVAFSVASTADSMTILDEPGAEELLGRGDMIYQPQNGERIRLQSAYVSDQEIERVVEYIRKNS